MDNRPSYNGVRPANRTVLRIHPKQPETPETRVTTQNPPTTTPSPRGHA